MQLFFFLYCLLPPATLTGTAVKIVDGDTFDLLSQGKVYRIRLNGIDCPERGQAYYRQAQQALGSMCANTVLTVTYSSKDRNGRLLGDVFVNGVHINLRLVQQGHAWHFKKYSNNQQLATAERTARAARLGLWKDANAVPPWEWRTKRYSRNRSSHP